MANRELIRTAVGYMHRYDKPDNLDKAITELEKATKTEPDFKLVLATLAEAHRLKYQLTQDPKWFEKAETYCNQALDLDSDIPAALVTQARIEHYKTGDCRHAIDTLEPITDSNPNEAAAFNGLAHAYERAGRQDEHAKTFERAASLRPNDWDSYNELGNFYSRQRDFPKAIAQFRRAIELTPDNAQVYANLGATYLDTGNPELLPEAEKALKKSIAITPTCAAYANLGVFYSFQHRFAESAAAIEQALQLDDHNWVVWSYLVTAYEWLQDTAKAKHAREEMGTRIEHKAQLKSNDAEALSAQAALYAYDKQNEKALQGIQTALAIDGDDPHVLSHIADAYELLGNRQLAINKIELALRGGLTKLELKQDPYLQRLLADPNVHISPQP